jgi:glycine/D-amino acid oxidase-like deaminating enzyme
MAPRMDKVPATDRMPTSTDVVVIGGGIAGAATAWHLAQKGIAVTLCEKGEIGAEQSGRNWGWTRVMGRDPREIPLAMESLRQWRRMDGLVGAETGFSQSGTLWLCETQDQIATYEAWLDKARPYQLDSRLLTMPEIAAALPGIAKSYKAALYTPSDGRAEPTKAAPAIALAARAAGATILTQCAVRGVETTGGAVSGVVTEHGRIACTAVVLAGGAWSRLFSGNMGIELPQLKVMSSVFRTGPVPGGPDISVGVRDFAFRKRLDGGYTIAKRNGSISEITPDSFRLFREFLPTLKTSYQEFRLHLGRQFLTELRTPRSWSLDAVTPFEQTRILDPEPNHRMIEGAKRALIAAFPAFAGMQEIERWGGLIDVTPDAVPVISNLPSLPGFHMATGFSGHGFGIGPGAGRLMADIVAGDTPIVDPEPYRLSRFSDGTWRQFV